MFAETILPILIAFTIITISPGPANIAVAAIAMGKGRSCGLQFGLGLSVGLAFWGLIAATGMGVILTTSEYALIGLKLFGGLYLLWLAYKSAVSASKTTPDIAASKTDSNWFWRGLLLNLSNPKAIVAWMAALSMGLGVGESTQTVAGITALCMVIGVLNYTGHAFAFSFQSIMVAYRKFHRWIEGVISGLFALAGFSLIKAAFERP